MKVFSITDKLQIFDMAAPWVYISVPEDKIPDIKPGGWGSIPINVTIEKTTWTTSMFPLKGKGYFIPVKRSVLAKEKLKVGDVVTIKYFCKNLI